MRQEQLPIGYVPHEHPVKDAIEIDVKNMEQSFLMSELRRLGTLYPNQLVWPKHLELYETCLDQWDHTLMTPKARKFTEDLVRKLQIYDRWFRRVR